MLVLTRGREEKVIVSDRETGEVIGTIRMIEAFEGRAKLGFEGFDPGRIGIDREEIYVRKQLGRSQP